MACWVMMPKQRSTWFSQGGVCRRVVEVVPRPPRQRGPDLGVLVGRSVVDDQMDVEVGPGAVRRPAIRRELYSGGL